MKEKEIYVKRKITVSDYDFAIKSRHVYLNDMEIRPILGIDIHIDPGSDPVVTLQIPVHEISVDGYTDIDHDLH